MMSYEELQNQNRLLVEELGNARKHIKWAWKLYGYVDGEQGVKDIDELLQKIENQEISII